jgi:hypothetical protein
MSVKRAIILILAILIAVIIACDKYNVVEPRFYSAGDLVDIPWYDSTYISVAVTVQFPQPTMVTSTIYSHDGNLIRNLEGGPSGALSEFTWVWDLKGNDSSMVDEGIYGFIISLDFLSDDEQTVVGHREKQVWFDLKYHNLQAFGLNYCGEYSENLYVHDMATYGDYLYVYTGIIDDNLPAYGLLILNYSDHDNPEFVSFNAIFDQIKKMEIIPESDLLIITVGWTIYLYDLTDPENPDFICYYEPGFPIKDCCANNDCVYFLSYYSTMGVFRVDISDPANPHRLDPLVIAEHNYTKIKVDDNRLAATFSNGSIDCGIVLADINAMAPPESSYTISTEYIITDIGIMNDLVIFATDRNQLFTIDISDINTPGPANCLYMPGNKLEIHNNLLLTMTYIPGSIQLFRYTDNSVLTRIAYLDKTVEQIMTLNDNSAFFINFYSSIHSFHVKCYDFEAE